MKSYDDGAGDDQFDELRQKHLDDAAENIDKFFVEGLNSKGELYEHPIFVTSDCDQFECEKKALKHQYRIERGAP